jgi:membrane protease YdiL (CAAX protease family)
VVVGLVLTVAIMTGARSFVDTGTELARCVDRLDAEARRLAAKEALELSTAIVRVRGSALLFALTAIVFPLAEERVYRGLLLDTLVKKYGSTYGLFASAVVFGVAHVPVYQLGLYQTVLLGIAFGAAYLEGGIVASIVVHATWNLLLLL